MTEEKPLWLVLNAASGSNDHAASSELMSALAAVGRAPARVVDCSEKALPTRAELEAGNVGVVACHTGDGTLNRLLASLEGWVGAVLVLPGGTTNLLAKAIHGERSATETVAGLADMRRVRRQCLRSAAGTALIEVLAGPGATWSDVREGLREGDFAEVAGKTVEAAQASTGGSMVSIRSPEIGKDAGYAGIRLTPLDHGIAVEGYGAETLADYLRQGIALLRRDFRTGPRDDLGMHPEVRCASIDGSPIELMFDGERCTGPAEITFSLAELDLDLLASGYG